MARKNKDEIKEMIDILYEGLKPVRETYTTEQIANILYDAGYRKQPTADVVEVKHGEWKEHFSFDCWHYDCSFCDDGFATKERDNTLPNYCGNFGAKMDGVRKEDV